MPVSLRPLRRAASLAALLPLPLLAQAPAAPAAAPPARVYVLRPARVWDGIADAPHAGWAVLVRGNRIEAVGPAASITAPAEATAIDAAGPTASIRLPRTSTAQPACGASAMPSQTRAGRST